MHDHTDEELISLSMAWRQGYEARDTGTSNPYADAITQRTEVRKLRDLVINACTRNEEVLAAYLYGEGVRIV